MDLEVAVREIRIQLEGSDDPHSIKFSDDIDPEDMRLVLQEAIENIAAKYDTTFEIFNLQNSQKLDLDNFIPSEIDTIILNPKTKTSYVVVKTDNENFIQGKSSSEHQHANHTPNKVMASLEEKELSYKRPAVVNSISKRSGKQTSDSIVMTHFLKRTFTGPESDWANGGVLFNTQPDLKYEKTEAYNGKYHETEIDTAQKLVFTEPDNQKAAHPHNHQMIFLEDNRQTRPQEAFSSNAQFEGYKSSSLNTGKIGLTSLDGNDKNIYSFKIGHGPLSFLLAGSNYNPKLPPPVYLPYEEIKVLRDISNQSVFSQQEITKDGELRFTDKDVLKSQQGVASEMFKKIAKNIMEGKGVTGISLPVRIFEPRSMVERVSDWFAYAPVFLTPASQTKDPVERIKYVVAYVISEMYVSLGCMKPFNPILGETYQGEFPEHNIKIYTEQTSHLPPVFSFYLVHPDWKAYGTIEAKPEMSLIHNCMTLKREGPFTIEFKDGHKLKLSIPHFRLGGMFSGERTFRYKHLVKVVDEVNGLKCVIKIDPSDRPAHVERKRKDAFWGLIYKYKKGIAKKDADDEKFKDLDQKIEDVHGQWLKCLYIGKEKWWDIDEHKPVRNICSENPLPSDWRYREDLVWVKRGNVVIGEEWKVALEERQRYERKLRETYQKKLKK